MLNDKFIILFCYNMAKRRYIEIKWGHLFCTRPTYWVRFYCANWLETIVHMCEMSLHTDTLSCLRDNLSLLCTYNTNKTNTNFIDFEPTRGYRVIFVRIVGRWVWRYQRGNQNCFDLYGFFNLQYKFVFTKSLKIPKW